MGSVVIVLVVAVVAVLVVARRLMGQPVQAKRLFLVPVVMLAVGVYQVVEHAADVSAALLLSIVVTGVLSVGLGMLRGATLRLYERDGVLWQKYTPWTFVVWAGSFAARFGVRAVLGGDAAYRTALAHGGLHGAAGSALMFGMLITSGLGFLGEALVVTPRALRLGLPFASGRALGAGGRRVSRFDGLVNDVVNGRRAARQRR
jgi:membrane protein CcdC involved in cytochrome C biogenesis